jgi:hypothetical protein
MENASLHVLKPITQKVRKYATNAMVSVRLVPANFIVLPAMLDMPSMDIATVLAQLVHMLIQIMAFV